VGGSSDNFHTSLSLCEPKLHNFVFVFSAITNIIFAYPQLDSSFPPGVCVPQVEKHWSRQCGILNISQPNRNPRPVTDIAVLFSLRILYLLWLHQPSGIGLHWRMILFSLGFRTVPVPQREQLCASQKSVASKMLRRLTLH
jgi:hypothetical protein